MMMTTIEELISVEEFEELQMLAEFLEFEAEYSPEYLAKLNSFPYTVGR